MYRQTIIAIIVLSLIGFIVFKALASFLCEPSQSNPVVAVISEVIPAPEPIKPSNPDPLSWGPTLQRLASLLSKACPR